MGKAKKRNMYKYSSGNGSILKRNEIIKKIILAIRNYSVTDEIKREISLFGVKAEELSEAGALFEEIAVLKSFL